LKNVASLSFEEGKCTGCGRCTEVCPHGVFELSGAKVKVAEKDLCMECGACALNCPAGAIAVNAGVGCALAIIMGWLTGTEPTCGPAGGACCG
jgi:NAD-dependent dihydropyrimidine dehydrogenase PreA subunit